MEFENIKTMNAEELETRAAEIAAETANADAETLECLNAELDAIEERKAEIKMEIEERAKKVEDVIQNKGEELEKFEETRKEENKMETRNTPEYINAYAEYLKSGNDEECRSLLSENATGGKVPIPEMVYDIVKTAWEREGIMSLVRKSYIRGNLKVGFEISGTDAVVHTEGGNAINAENLIIGTVNLIPKSIKKFVQISDEALDLTGESFIRYIYDELTYRIAKKAADELIAKIEACGTVSTTTCVGVPEVTVASIGVGTVAAAMSALSDEAANPVVMMNKATWGAFKSAQYANSFAVDPFEGLPVVFNNTIKAFSAASTGDTYAIIGDLGHGALANFPNGEDITFKFDDVTLATSDMVKIIGREFVAIEPVAPNAFVKVVK